MVNDDLQISKSLQAIAIKRLAKLKKLLNFQIKTFRGDD